MQTISLLPRKVLQQCLLSYLFLCKEIVGTPRETAQVQSDHELLYSILTSPVVSLILTQHEKTYEVEVSYDLYENRVWLGEYSRKSGVPMGSLLLLSWYYGVEWYKEIVYDMTEFLLDEY